MNPKTARQVLNLRRPGGQDDDTKEMRQAMEAANAHAELAAEFAQQRQKDAELAESLLGLELADEDRQEIEAGGAALSAKHEEGNKLSVKNPALWAVALGFLLLLAVLTWHFLGEAGVFPEEAVKIATVGNGAAAENFEPVETEAGKLQDWFMMKGYDGFVVPPGLAQEPVVGVRTFRNENERIAQAAIAGEHVIFFYSFPSTPFGINIRPDGSWRIGKADAWTIAIREERGICFMVAMRGNKAAMEAYLSKH